MMPVINPVRKITPAQLRECAKKYENNPRYFAAAIIKDLGIEIYNQPIFECSHILKSIADSIEQCYAELPTDRDGNQLYIGSTVYDADGNIYHVQGLSSGKFNLMLSKANEGKELAKLYRSSNFAITKPDSWGCIIDDALATGMNLITEDSKDFMLRRSRSKDEFVARCRKLAGEV